MSLFCCQWPLNSLQEWSPSSWMLPGLTCVLTAGATSQCVDVYHDNGTDFTSIYSPQHNICKTADRNRRDYSGFYELTEETTGAEEDGGALDWKVLLLHHLPDPFLRFLFTFHPHRHSLSSSSSVFTSTPPPLSCFVPLKSRFLSCWACCFLKDLGAKTTANTAAASNLTNPFAEADDTKKDVRKQRVDS